MKLTAQECFFIKQACENVSIKASDASFVAKVMEKVNKELAKLAESEGIDLNQPASAPAGAPATAVPAKQS